MTYTPEQISQIVLKVLKEIEEPDVSKLSLDEKIKLTQHPNTSPETLAVLATDGDPGIRRLVAEHSNTSTETLEVLATDKDPDVRDEVAKNPNATKIIRRLVLMANEHILELNTKQYDALKKLIESSQDESLKGIV